MRLPGALGRAVAGLYESYLTPPSGPKPVFDAPPGEPALVAPGSVTWRVFSNPVALFAGGVLSVLLELALPKVRHGVWDHTSFRTDPRLRLQRTGLAAMVTIYAARSVSMPMIEGVNRRHGAISGVTAAGEAYRADDEALLAWVHGTAMYGFARAYGALVRPLGQGHWDRVFAEGAPVAEAYGANGAPRSQAEWRALLDRTLPALEPSAAIEEFLKIMTKRQVLPAVARPLQGPLVRVAAGLVPQLVAPRLNLPKRYLPSPADRALARLAARAADHLDVETSPAFRACGRVGLDPAALRRLPHGG